MLKTLPCIVKLEDRVASLAQDERAKKNQRALKRLRNEKQRQRRLLLRVVIEKYKKEQPLIDSERQMSGKVVDENFFLLSDQPTVNMQLTATGRGLGMEDRERGGRSVEKLRLSYFLKARVSLRTLSSLVINLFTQVAIVLKLALVPSHSARKLCQIMLHLLQPELASSASDSDQLRERTV
jgi:hypothetical protein